MSNKIGKETAHVLQGVAGNLFTDTKRTIVQFGSKMETVYQAIRAVVNGRELDHVEYLLAKYRAALKDDPATQTAEGSVGQICAAVVKILKSGLPLPDNYPQARRLAYPPKAARAPRQPVAKPEPAPVATPEEMGATGGDLKPARAKTPLEVACAIAETLNLDDLTTLALLIEGRINALEAAEQAEMEEAA